MTSYKLTEEQRREVARFYSEGLSLNQLALRYSLSAAGVHYIVRSRGVQTRPKIQRGKENVFHRGGPKSESYVQSRFMSKVKSGVIKRVGACEACGRSPQTRRGHAAIVAHHCDYNKPFEVMWLCKKCHHDWHKVNTPIPLRVGAPRAFQPARGENNWKRIDYLQRMASEGKTPNPIKKRYGIKGEK